MGSIRPCPLKRRNLPWTFFFGGSIWCKQWVGLRAEWNSFLSALSTMSAALGTMEVSCRLDAFAKTASVLWRSFTEIWPAMAGRAYWKRATTRSMNICEATDIEPLLANWINTYSCWFMTAITLLIWVLVVRVGVQNTTSSLTWSTSSICVIGGGGTYWQRDGRLNKISLVLDVLIKSLLQSAHLCIWMYSFSIYKHIYYCGNCQTIQTYLLL